MPKYKGKSKIRIGIVETCYLCALLTVKYSKHNKINIENMSVTLTTTIIATKLIVASIINITIVRRNMTTKIRISMTVTEQ